LRTRARLPVRAAVAAIVAAAAWAFAAERLWESSVVPSLRLPRLDPRAYFSAHALSSGSSFETFLSVEGVLTEVVLIVVLIVYARRGAGFMRQSAAGPIGTGMLLGMLGLGIVWLAQLPFGVVGLWWQRRHHVSHQGYVTYVIDNFLSLGGEFLFISLALLITMGLARLLKRWWWVAAAPAFVAIYALFAFTSPYLIPELHDLHNPGLRADAATLARREGVGGTRVSVQNVHAFTSAPNAESTGFGPTRRVILWDTLLGGRFSRAQVRVVLAHELGHLAREHILKDIAWFALLAFPAAFVLALATRRRGGMGAPQAVPVALLATAVFALVIGPFDNARSRHMEAEADWMSLQTTRDPAAARTLFERLTTTSHSDPNPPRWSYLWNADHPTAMQRIAMVQAWEARATR
jgi:STE24 endopeptidase